MDQLPDDTLYMIFKILDLESRCNLKKVCFLFFSVISEINPFLIKCNGRHNDYIVAYAADYG